MPALRCSTCGINYPELKPSKCLVCDSPLEMELKSDPDQDWATAVKLLRKRRGDDIDPDRTITLFVGDNGWLYLSHEDLLDLGYLNLEDFMVVHANDKYFELQGFDKKRGVWWVELMEPEAIEETQGWINKFFGLDG